MLDLAEIDRELEQLGEAPDDWAALVARILGPDRSPERIDAMLATLGVGAAVVSEPAYVAHAPARRPSSHPPRALGRHARWTPRSSTLPSGPLLRPGASARDTLVGQPTASPPAPSGERPAELEASDLSRDTSPDVWSDRSTQQAAAVEPFPLAASQRAPAPESDAPEPSYDENDDVTEPAVVAHFTSSGSPLAPPVRSVDARATDSETAAERRVKIEALLDQDLDPRDFPSTPPKSAPASAAVPATRADEFELLVEEDEILELDDVDLVEEDD